MAQHITEQLPIFEDKPPKVIGRGGVLKVDYYEYVSKSPLPNSEDSDDLTCIKNRQDPKRWTK